MSHTTSVKRRRIGSNCVSRICSIPLGTIIVLFLITARTNAVCYFSPELQGSFITQRTVAGNEIQYSQINITEDSIPIWGICYRRIDNNVILKISSDETTCFRCFNLKLVARNVLRVCTTDPDYISKCYTNEEKALASCPSEDDLKDAAMFTEITLYKYLESDGEEIRKEYCPINGRYKITYNNNDGAEDFVECSTLDSELDNCPSTSAINLRFKKCSFENHEITFECLGHWEGLNKYKYLALKNAAVGRDKLGPQYRCAIYEENPLSGIITIWFSKDSTCSAIAKGAPDINSKVKFQSEALMLFPNEPTAWPHTEFCQFPKWVQGHWEHIVVKNDTLIFRDQTSLKAYTMKCIEIFNEDYILVFSRTQCDEESYQCLKLKNRSPNILEIQHSSQVSQNYTDAICAEENFDENRWLTQGRLDHNYVYSPCPVSGEFTGMIPDATNLCAKLSSECLSEDIMYYEVSACDLGEVYEERKYRCLGQWEENDLVYTYTKRLDVGTYECFVGMMTSDKQHRVFIKEAGEHCQRNVDPYRYGMELRKIAYCKRPLKPIHPTQRHQKSESSSPPQITTIRTVSATEVAISKSSTTIAPVTTQKSTENTKSGNKISGEVVLTKAAPYLLITCILGVAFI